MQSHQPLLAFIEKMRSRDNTVGVGSRRTTMALATFGRRLHWSLIARKDIEELRKVVTAGMISVNMMLGMQQLLVHHSLTRAKAD